MKENTLRTGQRIYRGVTNSPNFKGATAVRPSDSFNELAKRNAIARRLRKGAYQSYPS